MTYDMYIDPFERRNVSIYWSLWRVQHAPFLYASQAWVGQWLESFKTFPPR